MNRFRAKKKEKEDAPRPSVDSQPSGPFRMFGKGKKSQEDDGSKQMDLTAALPATDDFRTSLLMTGLSARFSMLREQDDPASKLGKASDDSVLFPKRQSRLMEFGFGPGLGDIVEVESIKASNFSGVDSIHTSDDGVGASIMDRARPNDGNNLFGGRQKIYKLGAGAKSGAMSGRTLYDDDVAKSSFQKWRVNERERLNAASNMDSDSLDMDAQNDYSRRRETSSTISSGVSAGRDSTAATSINSQFATPKDAQPAPTNSFGGVERSVTRTRRLYEQSLNQELHEQQSSTLSRMDTLSRNRSRPSRTPELTPPVPSPTATTFNERFTDRKSVNSKSSAPNLRSYSPQNNGPAGANSAEINGRNTSQDSPSFGGNPPLSPPISENDEYSMLPIQPNDVGKATAMGLFNRPAHQYDDSKFAQRQVQMKHGRDIPNARSATDPVADKYYSRSLSSTQRTSSEKYDSRLNSKRAEPSHTSANESSFFDDDDDDDYEEQRDSRNSGNHHASSLANSLTLDRPNDQEHPAFRTSALPTPLSLSSRASNSSTTSDHAQQIAKQPKDEPADNPGTASAGLSGMVRQHLRNISVASSVYDSNPEGQDSPQTYNDSPARHGMANWQLSEDEFNPRSGHVTPVNQASPDRLNQFRSRHQTKESRDEKEDFARHLADGARRVREKLTTYTDSDGEQQPVPAPPPVPPKDQSSSKSNALGILRSKSSRTSLFDRKGDKDSSEAKSAKVNKISSSATSPSLQRTGLDNKENGRDEGAHAGLKAFRQARRELQKMKEQDAQQRHLSSQHSDLAPERPGAHRAYSHDPGMSPPMYNGPMNGQRSRADSQAPSERDRSGSDTSNKGYSNNDRRGRRGVSHSRREDNQLYSRSRSVSQASAAMATPQLNEGSGAAPPVPPINPRRKNAHSSLSRRSEDASPLPSPRLAVNGNSEMDSDSDNSRQAMRRMTGDKGDNQFMNVPPAPTRRPPLPHANASTTSVSSGMF